MHSSAILDYTLVSYLIHFPITSIRRISRRPPPRNDHRLRVNAGIRVRTVRLIDADGKQVGIVPVEEALRLARLAELDLVEVAPAAHPPVCRILDYGKFQYEQAKIAKEQKKKQKRIDVKGLRIGLKTNMHDQLLRKKQTEGFLADGDKVRIEIVLRGREKAHEELARTILTQFLSGIEAAHVVEEPLAKSPRGLAVTIAPDTTKAAS